MKDWKKGGELYYDPVAHMVNSSEHIPTALSTAGECVKSVNNKSSGR